MQIKYEPICLHIFFIFLPFPKEHILQPALVPMVPRSIGCLDRSEVGRGLVPFVAVVRPIRVPAHGHGLSQGEVCWLDNGIGLES